MGFRFMDINVNLVGVLAKVGVSLDELSHISDAIESSYDGTELYYSQSFTDESMSFRLRAIYAES